MVMDFLGFYISKYAQKNKLSDATFFIEDFISLGEVATRRTRLSDKVARRKQKRKDDRALLECFVEYPGIWAYRIYSNPKKFLGRSVDRLAVQRNVHQLSNEGLIDRDEKDANMCLINKKGKRLSTYGIYYLFLNIQNMLDRIFKTILINYGGNILFRLFLYPYLDKKTLLAIQDSTLLSRIYLYLQQCCIEIGNLSYSLGDDARIWRNVSTKEPGARSLLDFLEHKSGLPWLKYASLEMSGDNNSLRIWAGANYASIKFDKDEKTATMEIKDWKKQKESTLIIKEPTPDFFRIGKPVMYTKHYWFARYLIVSTQQLVPSLLFDLASRAVRGTSDFEILRRDEKFRLSLEKIKAKFDSRYKSLIDWNLR